MDTECGTHSDNVRWGDARSGENVRVGEQVAWVTVSNDGAVVEDKNPVSPFGNELHVVGGNDSGVDGIGKFSEHVGDVVA